MWTSHVLSYCQCPSCRYLREVDPSYEHLSTQMWNVPLSSSPAFFEDRGGFSWVCYLQWRRLLAPTRMFTVNIPILPKRDFLLPDRLVAKFNHFVNIDSLLQYASLYYESHEIGVHQHISRCARWRQGWGWIECWEIWMYSAICAKLLEGRW